MSTTTVDPEDQILDMLRGDRGDHVVIVIGSPVAFNGQPQFMVKVYGPFTAEEVHARAEDIQRLEGGACLVRPLVSLADTYRRISAD